MSIKKIALFGYSTLSYELVNNLDTALYKVVIVDDDARRVAQALETGLDARKLDFRSDESLKAIGIGDDIEILFCFFPEDFENVFLTISARALDANLEIIAIVKNPDSADKLLAAGANKIIDPYAISGRKIYQLVKQPHITTLLDQTVFGRHDLNLAEIVIPEGSPLVNRYARDLHVSEHYNLILIGIVDKELGDALYFALGREQHKLDAGDILVVLGPAREIKIFKKEVQRKL